MGLYTHLTDNHITLHIIFTLRCLQVRSSLSVLYKHLTLVFQFTSGLLSRAETLLRVSLCQTSVNDRLRGMIESVYDVLL